MTLGVVGEGPAALAVAAACADVDCDARTVGPGDLDAVDLAVVVADAGATAFEAANAVARESETPWLAVELGGVGGHAVPGVRAAVSGYGPDTGCYDCLRGRVAANVEETGGEAGADPTVARFAGAIAGREAARLAADEPSTLLGGVIEVPHAERHFLPLPGCRCVPAQDRELSLTSDPRSLDEAAERAERGLDDRVGVVGELGEAESFPAPYYLAATCDTTGFSDASAPRQTAGVAVDWNAAFVKALGEAYERYSAAVYRTASFERGPAAEVAGAVPPTAFVTSPAFDAPDPADDLAWVPGRDLRTGERAALPAAFVQFPPPEPRYRPAITTGLGLGNDAVEAVLSGLYEVVERDAAMLAWYSTYDPLELAVEDEAYETLARRARSEGLSTTALLLTQDVDVPVVGVAVHREGGAWPRFATGMSASLDPVAAARAALEEAVQNWMELRGMGRDGAASESGAIGYYADFPAAARAFVDAADAVPADAVGPEMVPTGEAELDALLARLADADLDAYAARVTPPDVERIGFEAVRALVPQAQPLFTDDPYFGERAEQVPRDLGFEPRPGRRHHPFP
ncbi:MAG: YcaO-like family protein [Haloarculaceae archaeon]